MTADSSVDVARFMAADRAPAWLSVVFVPSDPPDIGPRGRLMAHEALADVSVWPIRDASRDHVEVHHVVTRRGLVALDAVA